MAEIIHGHIWTKNGQKIKSKTYTVWQNMWARCTNPKHPAYNRYGGAAITVCEAWKEFTVFLAEMGERPEGLTLERMDGTQGYSKIIIAKFDFIEEMGW